MLTKSKAAFLMSADQLFDRFPRVYFWTFTFKSTYNDWTYGFLWHGFIQKLCNRYGGMLQGLRVIEIHPSGHGLHYHALLTRRVPMWLVKSIGKQFGIGVCWVVPCERNTGHYLAKYLTKDSPLQPGMRRWGTIGGFRGVKQNNIRVESNLTHNIRWIQSHVKVPQIDYSTFLEIARSTALYGRIEQWPKVKFQLGVSRDKRSWGMNHRVKYEPAEETGREPSMRYDTKGRPFAGYEAVRCGRVTHLIYRTLEANHSPW